MKTTTCTVTFCSPDSSPDSLRAYLKQRKATEKEGVHTFQGIWQSVYSDLKAERCKSDDLAIFLIFKNAYGAMHLYTFPESLANKRSHRRGNLNQALTEAAILSQTFQTRYDARQKSPSPTSPAVA
jgi:hypothetical protein